MTSKKHYTTKPNPSFQPARKQRPVQSGIHVSAMKNGSMILKFHIDDNSSEQKVVKPPKTNVKQEWTEETKASTPKKKKQAATVSAAPASPSHQQHAQRITQQVAMLPIAQQQVQVAHTPMYIAPSFLPAQPQAMTMLPSISSLMNTIHHPQDHYHVMARNLLPQFKLADLQNI